FSMGRRLLRVPAARRGELPPLHKRPLRETQRPPRLRKTPIKRICSRRLRKRDSKVGQYSDTDSSLRPRSTVNHGRLCNTMFHPEIAEPHLLTQNHNSVL